MAAKRGRIGERGRMTGTKAESAGKGRAWLVWLCAGLAGIAGYFLLVPSDAETARNVYWSVFATLAVVGIYLGVRLNRPAHRLPWYLILAGESMLVIGDGIWNYYEVVLKIETPYPSVADAVYLGAYVVLVVGLSLLVRERTAGGDAGGFVDATIVAVGLGVVSWVYLMQPYASDPSMSLFERVVSIFYPLVDVLLLALLARLLLSPGARPRSFYFVTVAMVLMLTTDTIYANLVLNEAYQLGNPIDAGWLLAYTLWGAAALHPSMRALSEPAPGPAAGPRRRRIVLLAAASLLAPGVLAVEYARGNDLNVPVIVGGSAVLFLLSLVRMNGLVSMLSVAVQRYQRAVERETILREAASENAAALDRETICSSALRAARALLEETSWETAAVALGSTGSMDVVAATGSGAGRVEGGQLILDGCPEFAVATLSDNRPVALKRSECRGADGVLADQPFEEVLLIPLVVHEGLKGAIVVLARTPVREEAGRGLETLATQTALALEGAALAEDLSKRRSEERLQALVQNTSDVIMVLEADGSTGYVSPSYEKVLGHKPEDMVGSDSFFVVHPDDAARVDRYFARVLQTPGVHPPLELRIRHANGAWRHMESIANNLLDDPSMRGVVVNSRDTTERKRAEQTLSYQAFHDPLTGLPNRTLFLDRLEQALVRADRREGCVAVLFLDLDRFKVVNDSLGHEAGDKLLVDVSSRLQGCLRPEDTISRFGGDEFVILLEDTGGRGYAERIAERIVEALGGPFDVEGNETYVTASIGIVLNALDHAGPSDMLRDADIAMYGAKDAGKARHEVFDESMKARASRRLELENRLRRAIEREELRVYYQPKMDLSSGEIVGMEALVRWQDPERGLVSPAEFIPLAEETGLILPLGRWVLRKACRQAKEWQERYSRADSLTMAVNLSAKQFQQPNLAEEVAGVLREAGLKPGTLILEITEGMVMSDVQANMSALQDVKALGVKVAIDDFGTGYSSLAYLKRFPVDMIRVDRSFVRGLGQDAEDTAIVETVVLLARALNLRVVAEGIETAEQLDSLRDLGCAIGQGYYFAKPMPGDEAGELLAPKSVAR